MARGLVEHPADVSVRQVRGGQTVVIELKVAPQDMGKVIGKQGRIATAIRNVVRVAANRQGVRAVLEIR